MALTASYLMTTKNLESFFAAIQTAKAPERFTNKFLNQLDFTSSNDRLYLGLLKGLGFTDESGVPTKRYYAFLDQSESGRILAEAIREAYEDLFAINKKAQDLSVDEVKNKLRTLTQGQKSDNVVGLMAATFKALASFADWTTPLPDIKITGTAGTADPAATSATTLATAKKPVVHPVPQSEAGNPGGKPLQLRYDIHIHLPESRDPAVFDAIFDALRKHLGT